LSLLHKMFFSDFVEIGDFWHFMFLGREIDSMNSGVRNMNGNDSRSLLLVIFISRAINRINSCKFIYA